jgi:hypothetical protein
VANKSDQVDNILCDLFQQTNAYKQKVTDDLVKGLLNILQECSEYEYGLLLYLSTIEKKKLQEKKITMQILNQEIKKVLISKNQTVNFHEL